MITTDSESAASPIRVAIVAEVDRGLRDALERDPRFEVAVSSPEDTDSLIAAARVCTVIVTRHHNRLTRTVIESLHNLRVIAQGTSGVDNIDAVAAESCGVRVVSTPGTNANAVAEYVLGQLLAITRTLAQYDDMVRSGSWSRGDCASRHELRHYRLGIVGVGNVGSRVASVARMLGMAVSAFDPYIDDEVFARLDIDRVHSLDGLLERCSILTLHVPLTSETAGMIGEQQLRTLGRGAIVVNASRGEVLDFKALVSLLDSGHLAGAACDVFDPEPPGPLRDLPPVLRLSPHIAGCTSEAKLNAGRELYGRICDALGLAPLS